MRKEFDRFTHPQLIWQRSRLQNRADLLFESVPRLAGIKSADARQAAIRRAQPLQNFHGGCLARTVRSKQAEHFALLDPKTDAAHRLHRAIAFVKVFEDRKSTRLNSSHPSISYA